MEWLLGALGILVALLFGGKVVNKFKDKAADREEKKIKEERVDVEKEIKKIDAGITTAREEIAKKEAAKSDKEVSETWKDLLDD